MNRNVTRILIPTVVFAVVYLLWAFVATEIDFRKWPNEGRGLLVFIWALISLAMLASSEKQ